MLAWLKPASPAPDLQKQQLHGVWAASQQGTQGDHVRFYYFHHDNSGLVRYGKVGLSQTRSFKYQFKGKHLVLRFNKTGVVHHIKAELRKDDVGAVLRFQEDPVFGGAANYRKRLPPGAKLTASQKQHPLARVWIHKIKDRNGKEVFHMYQLAPPSIDGRGIGWYHQGDFDDWSTEALSYQWSGDKLWLNFLVRQENYQTPARWQKKGQVSLSLDSDPRNFWAPRKYLDGGPNFATLAQGLFE